MDRKKVSYRPASGPLFWEVYSELYRLPGAEQSMIAPQNLEAILSEEAQYAELLWFWQEGQGGLLLQLPHKAEQAFFGLVYFRSAAVAQALLAAAESVAQTRHYEALVGPLNFSTYYDYRLALSEAPWPVFPGEPRAPWQWSAWLEAAGYQAKYRYQSRLIQAHSIPTVYQQKQAFLASLSQIPYDFLPLNPENWRAYHREIQGLLHEIFKANPFYRALSYERFCQLYPLSFGERLCPHTSVLFVAKETGELAAISLCLPNYGALDSQESPVFKIDYPRLERPTMLSKTVGVAPAHRKQKLMSYLAAYGMMVFQDYYRECIFCLMREDNPSLRFTDALPYQKREYALFAKTWPAQEAGAN